MLRKMLDATQSALLPMRKLCWQRWVGRQTTIGQSAVTESVSKGLADPLSAAVSKPDTQRNYNAVSTQSPEEHHP